MVFNKFKSIWIPYKTSYFPMHIISFHLALQASIFFSPMTLAVVSESLFTVILEHQCFFIY